MLVKNQFKAIKQISEAGEGQAVIATLNVVDKDNDVTLPGAFGEQTAPMVPAHDWHSVPIGKADIKEVENEVIASFKMNLDTMMGRDWHSALKFDLENPPPKQEYSYGFSVLDSGQGQHEERSVRFLKLLKVYEISPVLLGAGVATRTLVLKSGNRQNAALIEAKAATPVHHTNTDSGVWDGPENGLRVKQDETEAYYRRIYAWQDPEGDVGSKSTWRFIHHFVSGEGEPGAASTRACIQGIAILNGARTGTTIPEADHRGIWNHLAGHLEDADISPPVLRSLDKITVKLLDEITLLKWDAEALAQRYLKAQQIRQSDGGRSLSIATEAEMKALIEALQALMKAIKSPNVSVQEAELVQQMGSMQEKLLNLDQRLSR